MSESPLLELLLGLFLAGAFGYITWALINEFSKAADDLRKTQLEAGDTSLGELYISLSPQTFFLLRSLITALFFGFGFLFLNTVFGLFLGAIAYFVPGFYLKRLREKRVRKIEQQLVDGLELLGNSLKSGLTMQQAVELLVKEFPPPVKQEFALVLSETRLGVEFTDALQNMAVRLRSNIIQILAAGVAITKRVGGDMTVIFSNIAQTIRDQANIEGKLDAVTAQGRFQGLVLGLMPFALIIVLYFIDRDHVVTLFTYQIGLFALGLVVMMVILAQVWIQKLLAIDV